MNYKKSQIIIHTDKEDLKKFKIRCIENETNPTKVLREFIKKYNKDNEEK
jgi:hypothetical protein